MLPVTGLVLVVLAVGALVSPAFRDQVELSTSRRHQPYVELFFAGASAVPAAARAGASGPAEQTAQAVCTRRGAKVLVAFVVASHLDRRRPVAYRVVVDPVRRGLRTRRASGSATLGPGDSVVVRRRVRLPARAAYTVTVVLPGPDQRLRAHCAGGRS